MSDSYGFLKRREAPTPLDRKDLDATNDSAANQPDNDVATKEEIAGRKILRIKRPTDDDSHTNDHKQTTSFGIFSALAKPTAETTPAATQPVSFFV